MFSIWFDLSLSLWTNNCVEALYVASTCQVDKIHYVIPKSVIDWN